MSALGNQHAYSTNGSDADPTDNENGVWTEPMWLTTSTAVHSVRGFGSVQNAAAVVPSVISDLSGMQGTEVPPRLLFGHAGDVHALLATAADC